MKKSINTAIGRGRKQYQKLQIRLMSAK